jgi:hypothetical protein
MPHLREIEMPWYTLDDARRDAAKQKAMRDAAHLPSPNCSTFCCASEGKCVVTEDGRCFALQEEADASRTDLGKKLREKRNAYIESGGKLYTQDDLDAERGA